MQPNVCLPSPVFFHWNREKLVLVDIKKSKFLLFLRHSRCLVDRSPRNLTDQRPLWRQDILYVTLQTFAQVHHERFFWRQRETRDLPGERAEESKHLSDFLVPDGNSHCSPRRTQSCVRDLMGRIPTIIRARRTLRCRARCYAVARKRFVQSSFRPNP